MQQKHHTFFILIKRKWLAFLLLIFSFSIHSQPLTSFDSTYRLAQNFYSSKNYQEAARLYEKIAPLEPKLAGENYYNAACSRALLLQKDSAYLNLHKALRSGWSDLETTANDADLKILWQDNEWKNFLEDMKFQKEKRTSSYMWGMFFGILFILFFYNLLLYFSIRDKSYLWYSLSIFFFAHFEYFRTPDFGEQLSGVFFWMKYISIPGNGITMINLFMVCFLLFTKEFLNLKETLPKMVKWIHIFIAVFSVLSILLLAVAGIPLRFYVFALVLISYMFIYILAIVCWRRKFKPARFFIIANTALLIGVYMHIFYSFRIISVDFRVGVFATDNNGLILFYLLLALALGDRINILKKEKAEAQENALLKLEEKVKERTEEIVKQKELIEEKQKEILDSIRYARRIQRALITNEVYIQRCLKEMQEKKP